MTAVDVPISGLSTPNGAETHLHPASHRGSMNGSTSGLSLTSPGRDGDALSTMSSMNDLEARCGGCKKVIDQENGGIVVAFGLVDVGNDGLLLEYS